MTSLMCSFLTASNTICIIEQYTESSLSTFCYILNVLLLFDLMFFSASRGPRFAVIHVLMWVLCSSLGCAGVLLHVHTSCDIICSMRSRTCSASMSSTNSLNALSVIYFCTIVSLSCPWAPPHENVGENGVLAPCVLSLQHFRS